MIHHAMHFSIRGERAVYALREARARRQVEHVAMAQQRFGSHLVEDGPRVDLAGDLKGDTRRDVGLDETRDHVHGRPLGGQDQVDARGARLLRQPGDEFLDLLAGHHHEIGQLVDDHDHIGQGRERHRLARLVERAQRVGERRPALRRFGHAPVEPRDIPHPQARHEAIAPVHLGDTPTQGVGGVAHVGDHRRQQMRDPLVDRQLQHLGIDEDQAHLLGAGLVEQAEQHGVDGHRLARARGPRHQQMRHTREIGHHRLAADVLAQRQGQRRCGIVIGLGAQNLAQANQFALGIGDLEAHHGLARDHLDHAHAHRRQGARQILGQSRDLAHLDARRGLQFEAGDDRPRMHRDHLHRHPEVGELDFHQAREALERLGRVGRLERSGRIEQRQGRQRGIRAIREDGHLAFAFGAIAGLDRLRRRVDAQGSRRRLGAGPGRRGTRDGRLGARDGRAARRAAALPAPIALAGELQDLQDSAPGAIGQCDPRQMRGQRDADQHQRQQDQRGA